MNDQIISMNDYVTVTLTQHGADIMNARYAELVQRWPKTEMLWNHTFVAGDVMETQLWSLMNWFDGHVRITEDVIFTDFQLGKHKEEREASHE